VLNKEIYIRLGTNRPQYPASNKSEGKQEENMYKASIFYTLVNIFKVITKIICIDCR